MSSLQRFFSLPREQRALFFRALMMLVGWRMVLWLAPFPTIRRLLRRPVRPFAPTAIDTRWCSWAVTRASRLVPSATCLTQSLAMRSLLLRLGFQAQVKIGVALDGDAFAAHAWVETGGQAVLNPPSESYRQILTWDEHP
jgi:hypothetical protein